MLGEELVTSPLPGKVLSIKVKENDKCKEGDVLLTIESLKMENEIVAPVNGVVKEIKVSVGSEVEIGTPLVVLESEE